MFEKTQLEVFDEAVKPHLATDEGQKFLAGRARLEEVRSCLTRENPAAGKDLSELVLQFMWEEISTVDFQTRLKVLFESHSCLEKELNPTLMADISTFLNASVESEAEQASVKKMICDLFGLLTHPSSKGFSRDTLDEGMKFQMDVHERFKSEPGKYEEYLHAGFGEWREGRDPAEVKVEMLKLLEGNEDLIQRFKAVFPTIAS